VNWDDSLVLWIRGDDSNASVGTEGALFYDFIGRNPELFSNVKVYEPELFSGYIIFNEENPPVRKSSYNLMPK
jgi:hypothetical protein